MKISKIVQVQIYITEKSLIFAPKTHENTVGNGFIPTMFPSETINFLLHYLMKILYNLIMKSFAGRLWNRTFTSSFSCEDRLKTVHSRGNLERPTTDRASSSRFCEKDLSIRPSAVFHNKTSKI